MSKELLVVVDMQVGFTRGSLANPAAEAIIPAIVKRIDNFDGTAIVVTRDTHDTNYLETFEGKHLPVEHCLRGTADHEIVAEIAIALARAEFRGVKVIYVDKPTFGYTNWQTVLKKHGITVNTEVDKFVYVGTCTGICVLSNAVITRALYPEIQHEIIATECACITEETHENALKAMTFLQMNIIWEHDND